MEKSYCVQNDQSRQSETLHTDLEQMETVNKWDEHVEEQQLKKGHQQCILCQFS